METKTQIRFAKYAGKCGTCGKDYPEGTAIVKNAKTLKVWDHASHTFSQEAIDAAKKAFDAHSQADTEKGAGKTGPARAPAPLRPAQDIVAENFAEGIKIVLAAFHINFEDVQGKPEYVAAATEAARQLRSIQATRQIQKNKVSNMQAIKR